MLCVAKTSPHRELTQLSCLIELLPSHLVGAFTSVAASKVALAWSCSAALALIEMLWMPYHGAHKCVFKSLI